MELGPCRAFSGHGTTYHPQSWNTNASIFFVDQPIGVGFSYDDYGEIVVCSVFGRHGRLACLTAPQSTTEEAAKDIAAFVAIFFRHFTQFQGRPFHMAGESYGVSLGYIDFIFGNTK